MFLSFRYVQYGAPGPTHSFVTSSQHPRGSQQADWAVSLALRRGRKSRLSASLDPAALPFGLWGCLEDLPGKRSGISHLKAQPSVCSMGQGRNSSSAFGREVVGRSPLNKDTGRSTPPARKGCGELRGRAPHVLPSVCSHAYPLSWHSSAEKQSSPPCAAGFPLL